MVIVSDLNGFSCSYFQTPLWDRNQGWKEGIFRIGRAPASKILICHSTVIESLFSQYLLMYFTDMFVSLFVCFFVCLSCSHSNMLLYRNRVQIPSKSGHNRGAVPVEQEDWKLFQLDEGAGEREGGQLFRCEHSLSLGLNLWGCVLRNDQKVSGKSREERLLTLQKPRKISSLFGYFHVQRKTVPPRR